LLLRAFCHAHRDRVIIVLGAYSSHARHALAARA
jgi:hypothetical protein